MSDTPSLFSDSLFTNDSQTIQPIAAATVNTTPKENVPEAVHIDLDSLNPAQKQAASTTHGPLLVLAGAGSGKTRVLTYRIAHMIGDEGVKPWQILAITFTNKAAAEMRERLSALLPKGTRGMWVSTFHSMCVRMLREDGELLGYEKNFTIYDTDDAKRLIKNILNDFKVDIKKLPVNKVVGIISNSKNAMVGPEEFSSEAIDPQSRIIARVYKEYERRLGRANAMDFDDLLLKTYELLNNNPSVLEAYQERFRFISVDEYQDTNAVQYGITNLLAKKYKNLMVVGDDDQSIYSWRGADIQNILSFKNDYPEALVVKLEQNYRSFGHILNAANAVVRHNAKREEKRLFTDRGLGEKIRLYQAADERDEGRWIGSEIEKLHDKGRGYGDIAVFYRTNAQSRTLEDMLLRAGVPYKIVGGTRFFDRAEIRDVMAYLKLTVNPDDDVAATRVVNTPRRGIGATSIQRISDYAADRGLSFFAAAEEIVETNNPAITAKARNALSGFVDTILSSRKVDGELKNVVDILIEKTGLVSALQAEESVEAQSRIENIKEFLNVALEFDATHDDIEGTLESLQELREAGALDAETAAQVPDSEEASAPLPLREPPASEKLPAFIEWLALRSDLDALSGQNSAVTLMTVHSAKGLEFPVVFVAGMEESIFPHKFAGEAEVQNLEEERRLAYVAITRAQEQLYLSYATTRHVFGSVSANPLSRFVREIPDEDLDAVGIGSVGLEGVGWEKRGDRHGTFGSGRGSEVYGGNIFGSRTRSTGGTRKSEEERPGFVFDIAEFDDPDSSASVFGAGTSSSKPKSRRNSGSFADIIGGSKSSGFSFTTSPSLEDTKDKQARREARRAARVQAQTQARTDRETPADSTSFALGDSVVHKVFGPGTVMKIEGDRITVNFPNSCGMKSLLMGYAPMAKVK